MLSSLSRRRLLLGFALALLIAIGNSLVAYRAVRALDADDRWVLHSQQVLTALGDTGAAIDEAESAEREYLLTGDSAALASYTAGVTRVPDLLARLRSLTADNSTERNRLDALTPAIDAYRGQQRPRFVQDRGRPHGPRSRDLRRRQDDRRRHQHCPAAPT